MAMKRIHYFAGQLLSAADFQAEQDYHLGKQRQLNLQGYGAGVVSGLRATVAPDGVHLSPGMAIDQIGNEIVLADP